MVLFGSPARTRTADPMVNSHLLYRLSYWGIIGVTLYPNCLLTELALDAWPITRQRNPALAGLSYWGITGVANAKTAK